MQAQQQDGDGGRAGYQSAGESEHQYLSVGYLALREASADIVGMGQFVRVLIAGRGKLQFAQLLENVEMSGFGEFNVEIMNMIAVIEMQSRDELMRLGNFFSRLKKILASDKRKHLALAIFTFGFNR